MHFELKPISSAGVSDALEKAERYRLLNEPSLAESICLDVLEAEPENQRALVTLLLARTDQFGYGTAMATARELLPRLKSDYDQHYYAGIIWERSAHAQIRKGLRPIVFQRLRCASSRPCIATNRPSNCGRPVTTMRSCAGTPVRGF